jgi:hypothetical protein
MTKKNVVKRIATVNLKLTQFEIVHIRDLMSTLLSLSSDVTMSEQLADSENRKLVESRLWEKVCDACSELNVPLGDDAPEYVVGPTAPSPLGIFQLTYGNQPPKTLEEEE